MVKTNQDKIRKKIIAIRVSPEEHAYIEWFSNVCGITMTELLLSQFVFEKKGRWDLQYK